MNRTGIFLFCLLIVQLGVTALLYREEMSGAAQAVAHSLVNTGTYIVDEINIEDGQGGSIALGKVGERWLLPALDDLPADPRRVSQLLEQLTELDPGWPVAHSLAARQRFQVAHYHFRRRVVLSAQQRELGTVFLGTSPGFRKVHARNNEQDDVYSVDLNLFDLPVQADKWLDPRLLQIRAAMAITADGYSLRRSSGSWRLGSGENPDPRELQALLDALRNLQVQGIAPAETTRAIKTREADLILQVEALAGNSELQLFRLQEEHFVRSSEYPYLFRISAYEFDKLTGIDSFLLSGR